VWWTPCLLRQQGPDDCVRVRLGDPVVDDYLEFVAARCRPNTVLATAYDLKVFFSVVGNTRAHAASRTALCPVPRLRGSSSVTPDAGDAARWAAPL